MTHVDELSVMYDIFTPIVHLPSKIIDLHRLVEDVMIVILTNQQLLLLYYAWSEQIETFKNLQLLIRIVFIIIIINK